MHCVMGCARKPCRHIAAAPCDLSRWVVRSVESPVAGAWQAPLGQRVVRGGAWNNNPQNLRSANRNNNTTGNRNNNIGLRVASTFYAFDAFDDRN